MALRRYWAVLALAFVVLAPRLSWSQASTAAGDFWAEPATLVSLGFEWRITGDDNRNASVAVAYRRKGEQAWKTGLPLLRLQREVVTGEVPSNGGGRYNKYVAPNMFAGSILNLEPDTQYECRFVLRDPDGVRGAKTKVVTVRTRKEPMPAAGGHVYHVYPFNYQGTKQEPAFTGLLAAYYMGSDESDHSRELPPRVQPGDTILVHAGVYKDSRFHYGGVDKGLPYYGTPFDGTYYLTQSGTPDKPIVIKGAGDGEVVFDGDGNDNLFNLMGGNYIYFEGITVRSTNVAFKLGIKYIAGSSGFTLKHSRVYDVGRVVEAGWSGSKDFYIADNVLIGRHEPRRLVGWNNPAVWGKDPNFPALITSEYAIKVYGQGHVIAHNYIANWHDGVDIDTYGDPDGTPNELRDRVPVSIDIYGNDIFNIADNCIETDGGAHNIRVFENRCFESAGGAFSAQPMFGGPVYFVRNLAYAGTTGGYMKLIDTPAGILIYQNTVVGVGGARFFGPASNQHLRNNLILTDGWTPTVLTMVTFTNYSSSDYNGVRPDPDAQYSFEWDSPEFGVPADFTSKPIVRKYKTLQDYGAATGQDKHSVLINYDSFAKVSAPNKADPQHLYLPEDFDFQLRPGSPAVDAGVELPTITDGFTGKAPDLGAYELGKPVPHYGPRSQPPGAPGSEASRSVRGPP